VFFRGGITPRYPENSNAAKTNSAVPHVSDTSTAVLSLSNVSTEYRITPVDHVESSETTPVDPVESSETAPVDPVESSALAPVDPTLIDPLTLGVRPGENLKSKKSW
jgi:hypothetical protein